MLDLNWSIPTPQRPHRFRRPGQAVIQARAAAEAEFLEGRGRGVGPGSLWKSLRNNNGSKKEVFLWSCAVFFFTWTRQWNSTRHTRTRNKKSILTIYTSRDSFFAGKNPHSLLHQFFVGWFVAPIFDRQMKWWLTLLFSAGVLAFFFSTSRVTMDSPKKFKSWEPAISIQLLAGFFMQEYATIFEIEAYMILSIEPNCCEALDNAKVHQHSTFWTFSWIFEGLTAGIMSRFCQFLIGFLLARNSKSSFFSCLALGL